MKSTNNIQGLEERFGEIELKTRNITRAILYTDTIRGQQTLRDDLWAISSSELNEIKSFLSSEIQKAEVRVLEAVATEIEKDIYEQQEGKVFSRVAAKCLEAPFPAVAIEHAFKGLRDRSAKIIRSRIQQQNVPSNLSTNQSGEGI